MPSDFGGLAVHLGELSAPAPGVAAVIIGGLHGNEPGGVAAARAVLTTLADQGLRAGRVAAAVGHPAALAQGVRHMGADLNRLWDPTPVPASGPDHAARAALAAWLAPRLTPPALLIDLHTTSAAGPPFALAVDTPAHRALAACLPVPLVVGLLEAIGGTLAAWATAAGHRAVVVEAGPHADPATAATLHDAALRLLGAVGCAAPPPAVSPGGLFRLAYRHAIDVEAGFVMDPGHVSFEPVAAGQPLGRDHRGVVRSPRAGRLLMPLYQAQGTDGFFVIEPTDSTS